MNKNTTLHRRGVLQIAAIFGAMSALSRRFFDTRGVARPAYHVELL